MSFKIIKYARISINVNINMYDMSSKIINFKIQDY